MWTKYLTIPLEFVKNKIYFSACNPSGLITVMNPAAYTNGYAQTEDGSKNCTVMYVSFGDSFLISDCSTVSKFYSSK